MLACTLAWIGFSALGALPLLLHTRCDYLDAFFETMSGFTTTGITVFTGLDMLPDSIVFWRSLTQWIGGLGILAFFLAIVARGRVSHHLFSAESHKIENRRPVPGLLNTLRILLSIYIAFRALVALLLLLGGMSVLDSVCHSFTALSTGGFSPHDASIGFFDGTGEWNNVLIQYVLILGMLLGGINFLVHYRVLRANLRALWDNTEMRWWWALVVLFTAVIFFERLLVVSTSQTGGGIGAVEHDLRTCLFQTVSRLTTTGFTTSDIGGPYFGVVARQLFLVMMVIGGCVGSTGGGIKVLRVGMLFRLVRSQVARAVLPRRAVNPVVIDGKIVEDQEMARAAGLFFAWIAILVLGGVVTAALSDLGGYSAFSGMFSAMGNIGPCYIPVPGMAALHPVVKMLYILGMLAGRLEIVPVLPLFSGRAWRS